jgi:hypothetical protein
MNQIGRFDYAGGALTPLTSFGTGGERFGDVVSTDLDAQPDDEILSVSYFYRYRTGPILQYEVSESLRCIVAKHKDDGGDIYTVTSLPLSTFNWPMILPLDLLKPSIRVSAGNFDRDPAMEVLVACINGAGATKDLWLVEVDSSYHCAIVASITNLPLEEFDVTAGDFDGDKLDEACVMTTTGTPSWSYSGITYSMRALSFDFNYHTLQFSQTIDTVFTSLYQGGVSTNFADSIGVGRLSLCSGEADLDGRDELVLAYEIHNVTNDISSGDKVSHRTLVDPFDVGEGFDLLRHDPAKRVKVEEWTVSNPSLGLPPTNHGLNKPLQTAAVFGDLNRDGRDEILIAAGRKFCIYAPDNLLNLTRKAERTFYSTYGLDQTRMFVIEDLNADTADTDWRPEIVGIGFTNDPAYSELFDWWRSPGDAYLCAFSPTVNAAGEITGLVDGPTVNIGTYSTAAELGNWCLTAGDWDGNAVRLGVPLRTSRHRVMQPIVVLNAPPTHFDILESLRYDIHKCYLPNIPTLYARYETTTDSTNVIQTEMSRDWGVSAELSRGGSFLGIGLKATLKFKYGEEFSRDSTRSHKLSFAISTDAIYEDEVYVAETNYNLFEYPVYYRGGMTGHVLVASPQLQEKNWYAAKELITSFGYAPTHEVGNLLSYPNYFPFSSNPAFGDTVMMSSAGLSLDQNPNRNWSVSITDFTGAGAKRKHKIGTSVGIKVTAWGFEAKVEGKYDQSELTTLRTEVMNQFSMKAHYDGIDRTIGEVNHNVTPYVYWATNGALTLDYNVNINPEANPWWQTRYGNRPDPAFALPWRYDPEKSLPLSDPSKRNQTADISFRPSTVSPGDTILIVVHVNNHSLLACTQPVSVRLFLGDPAGGGTRIVGIDGDSVLTEHAPIDARSRTELLLEWIVPEGVPTNPRIYGVIDAEQSIDEIHENNNTGYNVLRVDGITSVPDLPGQTSPREFALRQNYPNPFNPATHIAYSVPKAGRTVLVVYDVLGRMMAKLVDEVQGPGEFTVQWDASAMPSGVYFCRLSAGSFVQTKKLMLLK